MQREHFSEKGEKMKEKTFYHVDRGFCEKMVALLNHSTFPVMDIFQADKKVKRQIVIDYDPQAPKVKFTYYEEENQMSDKKDDILNKAENVILKKIKQYEERPQDMSDKDCYALQLLVMTEGRILSIRNGINREAPY